MKKTIRIEFNRKRFIAGSAALMVGALTLTLFSQDMTMTTLYPSPTGIYRHMITTGGTSSAAENTILARDAGAVGIGTTNPGSTAEGWPSKLDISGMIQTEGNRMVINGFDGDNNFWFRTPTPEPNSAFFGFVKDPTDGSAHGVIYNVSRAYIQGFDAANNFWFMSTSAEPDSAFLGFNGGNFQPSRAVFAYRDTYVRGTVRSFTTGLPSFLVAVQYNDDTGASYGCPAGYTPAGTWHVSCGPYVCGIGWDGTSINNGWMVECVATQ